MALQHLFAFSSNVEGAAIAAGSPYGCGGQTWPWVTCYSGGVDVNSTVMYTKRRVERGFIDPIKHLRDTPVLLFSGKSDLTVLKLVMEETQGQLELYKTPSSISSVFNTSAAHVWSLDHGSCRCGACAFSGNESGICCNVNNCGYDLSGDLLRRFYGAKLMPRVTATAPLQWVRQWNYLPSGSVTSDSTLLEWALVYVPHACSAVPSSCRIHINYHGCSYNRWYDRLLWAKNIDLNEYAEANGLVIVYPQAGGSDSIGEGCWNWASYADDPLFDTRGGIQLNTVISLVDDIDHALAHWSTTPVDTEDEELVSDLGLESDQSSTENLRGPPIVAAATS